MHILIIAGSPHAQGTSALLKEEFSKGAESAGHVVTCFDAAREEIHPCIGCDHCRKTSEGCVFKDGMEKLNPDLLAADLVVFVTPLYYFGMSAQIKAVIDRFYANNAALRSQKKKAILLATCGDADDWAMDALKAHYRTICGYLKWNDIGTVYAFGSYTRKDIENSDYPNEAYRLGKSLS